MTVYSFFIFDRHTECIYQRRWTAPPTSAAKRPTSTASTLHTLPGSTISSPPQSTNTSRPQSRSQQSRPQSSSSTPAPTAAAAGSTTTATADADPHSRYPTSTVSPKAANEAKLLFGVIFSLRNLTRQLGGSLHPHSTSNNHAPSTASSAPPSASASSSSLVAPAANTSNSTNTNASTTTNSSSSSSSSAAAAAAAAAATNPSVPGGPYPSGGYDEFLSYTTGEYKLHYYETATSLKFCMMTDPRTANLRVVLHQIWANLWVEYVVRNPLASVEHGTRGDPAASGVGNELFEMGLDRFVAQVVNPV